MRPRRRGVATIDGEHARGRVVHIGLGRTADCTSSAIRAALPGGAEVDRFDFAKVGDTEWAAARVQPGPTVFFLQWTRGAWQAEDSDSVCGTASAGLPAKLLDYCQR